MKFPPKRIVLRYFSCFAIILVLLVSVSCGAAAPVKIDLKMDNKSFKKGTSFGVSVEIDTTTAIRGAQWKLSFDPKVMQLSHIDEGDLMKNWAAAHQGTTVQFPAPNIDNAAGKVSDMGIAIMSSLPGGAIGKGTLCTYTFTALADGDESLVVSDILLVDVKGDTFPYTMDTGK